MPLSGAGTTSTYFLARTMNDTSQAEQSAIDQQHPWLGLASFTEETRQFFYGREEEVAELGRRVQRKLLTILFGQSGLGKTSILRAGIVPRLRPEGYCPVYVRIDYSPETPPPSEQIKQAIFRATESSGSWTQPGTAVEGESLWEFLHHRDDMLRDAAGKPIIPLLIFDQFEEIFTLAQADDAGRKRAAQFIEDLADLVENRPPKVLEAKLEHDDAVIDRFDFSRADYRILIALREDYLAHLEGVKTAMPSITQNRMRLARMNGQQALAAVTKPGGKLVTQEVAEAIVRFTAGGSELPNAEVEPSLLSLICRELNNARIAQQRDEISADLLAGSNDTILNEFYERALADQPAAVRKVIEDDLLTESGYRENLAEERVLKAFTAAGAQPDAATTLATLVNRRLLRIEERLDVRRVELTHDVLCGVVQASRELRLEREALEEAEKQLVAQKERERATRKALIRARQIASGCVVLSVVAVGSAIYGYFSAQRAQRAEVAAQQVQRMADTSRGEAEKLVVYLLDDFYDELAPVGRLDAVGSLAKSAVAYYDGLPEELRTAATQRNHALALLRQGGVLINQGVTDDATALINRASKIAGALRDQGDTTPETALAVARAQGAQGNLQFRRVDFAAALKSFQTGLEVLKPVVTTLSASSQARLLEVQLTAGIAAMMRRTNENKGALDMLLSARDLAGKIGALDLTNLPATEALMVTERELSDAYYFDQGKSDLAIKTSSNLIVLADRVLERRPDHRPALRFKAGAINQISRIDYDNLRVAAALKRDFEQHAVLERLVALDKSSVTGWTQLGFLKTSIASKLRDLGRVDESVSWYEASVALAGKFKVDGLSARNLATWNAQLAYYYQNVGEFDKAQQTLAEASRYAMLGKTGSQTDYLMDVFSLGWPAVLKRIAGRQAEARTQARQAIALLDKNDKGKTQGTEYIRWLMWKTIFETSYAMADYAAAEEGARGQDAGRRQNRISSLADESLNLQAGVDMALALARQGKQAEARALLAPMVAFFSRKEVVGGDDNELQVHRAQFHLALALAFPAERQKHLAEAVAIYEARPLAIRHWKEFAHVGEEIMREKNR
jgi:tetratricopeptide (TPR) repeat protein